MFLTEKKVVIRYAFLQCCLRCPCSFHVENIVINIAHYSYTATIARNLVQCHRRSAIHPPIQVFCTAPNY